MFADMSYFSGMSLLKWEEYLSGGDVKTSSDEAIRDFERFVWKLTHDVTVKDLHASKIAK